MDPPKSATALSNTCICVDVQHDINRHWVSYPPTPSQYAVTTYQVGLEFAWVVVFRCQPRLPSVQARCLFGRHGCDLCVVYGSVFVRTCCTAAAQQLLVHHQLGVQLFYTISSIHTLHTRSEDVKKTYRLYDDDQTSVFAKHPKTTNFC